MKVMRTSVWVLMRNYEDDNGDLVSYVLGVFETEEKANNHWCGITIRDGVKYVIQKTAYYTMDGVI